MIHRIILLCGILALLAAVPAMAKGPQGGVAVSAGTNNLLLGQPQGNGSQGGSGSQGGQLVQYLGSLPVEDLSQVEIDDLVYMVEEEKLARDVYAALGELWMVAIFPNIAQSEQAHMDAISALLTKYGLDSPLQAEAGVFGNTDLQSLYDALTAQGSQSLVDALLVGATIEDVDIYDLGVSMASADNEDILAAYQNLQKGSRNHMRAFTAQLELQGETYMPQYITWEEYDAIIGSAMERGLLDAEGEVVSGPGVSGNGGSGSGSGGGSGSGSGGGNGGDCPLN